MHCCSDSRIGPTQASVDLDQEELWTLACSMPADWPSSVMPRSTAPGIGVGLRRWSRGADEGRRDRAQDRRMARAMMASGEGEPAHRAYSHPELPEMQRRPFPERGADATRTHRADFVKRFEARHNSDVRFGSAHHRANDDGVNRSCKSSNCRYGPNCLNIGSHAEFVSDFHRGTASAARACRRGDRTNVLSFADGTLPTQPARLMTWAHWVKRTHWWRPSRPPARKKRVLAPLLCLFHEA